MRVDRHAIEVRLLLDLLAFELHRLGLAPGAAVGVSAGRPDLREELADRLWPDHPLTAADGAATVVHLLDVEGRSLPGAFAGEDVLVAFRNRISHKSLVARGWGGVSFAAVEGRLARAHRIVASRGVMGPAVLAGVLAAAAASRRGRYGRGFHLNDRALLSPSTSGAGRRLCAYGLVVATRRGRAP